MYLFIYGLILIQLNHRWSIRNGWVGQTRCTINLDDYQHIWNNRTTFAYIMIVYPPCIERPHYKQHYAKSEMQQNYVVNQVYAVSCHHCPNYPPPPPDSKVHGANMGPIWGRQDPGGPHVGPMNFAIWPLLTMILKYGRIRSWWLRLAFIPFLIN